MLTPYQVTAFPPDAVILCGGEGRRLAGLDKPLQALAGRPLIERVIKQVQPQTSSILISANRSQREYARYTTRVREDGVYSGCGPLAGFVAGLTAASTATVLCVPGDAPMLPMDLVSRLSAARDATNAALSYAHDGSGPQPLCCLLDRALLPDLRNYLDNGGRTPREWFAQHGATVADFSDAPHWIWSTNTPEEWNAAEQHLLTEAET